MAPAAMAEVLAVGLQGELTSVEVDLITVWAG
jgi:hypothetical protein